MVVTLTSTQFATADYHITNGSATEPAFVVYSRWLPASGNWPAGWRTQGYYRVEPGGTRNLSVPQGNTWVYIYVERGGSEIKPIDHATKDNAPFWIHPSKSFTVVETNEGDFLRSNRVQWSLEQATLYKYRNGGSHTITHVSDRKSLASRVFNKYSTTLQRRNIQAVLPAVLDGLKAPNTQRLLNPSTINLVVSNPNLLRRFVPDIDPKFVTLLKTDADLRAMLRDPQVQRLLQNPAAIDELAGLLRIGEPVMEVAPETPISAHQNLRDLSAQEIYNQAINSVVWIHAGEFTGSGVLIDRKRKLVVTNQHVIENTVWVDVFFPWRNQNGRVNKNADFYRRNKALLQGERYLTKGKVIRQNVRNDLAIVQLVQIPTTAREIKHDFSRNVEDSMRQGDIVHILGNPGERLWNYTQGTFQRASNTCVIPEGACLEITGDAEAGNSGGPILNSQGILVGILTSGTDETWTGAVPTRNIKALLNRVPANLPPISALTYPKQVFRIRNNTGVTIPYQIRWSNSNDWQSESLETGFIVTHRSSGQNIPSGYPQIRFDHIAGDEQVTYRGYNLDTAHFREGNNNHAPTYFFRYNQRGDRLNLFHDALAAPSLSKAVPEETVLLTNYPNPFNPETWIPYELAKPAEVTVTIYTADGKLVRTLALGHQPAGVYQIKSRAAYWDGRNEIGEPVASGLYFYTLKAGDFTATRKMLIRK